MNMFSDFLQNYNCKSKLQGDIYSRLPDGQKVVFETILIDEIEETANCLKYKIVLFLWKKKKKGNVKLLT